MTPEDCITILLPLVWAGFLGLPFVGVTLGKDKQKLFERISDFYFRFVGLFSAGSFIFLIGENQWKDVMTFLINGQMWIIHVVFPSLFWVFAGYYFYAIWRDVIRDMRAKETEGVKQS